MKVEIRDVITPSGGAAQPQQHRGRQTLLVQPDLDILLVCFLQ